MNEHNCNHQRLGRWVWAYHAFTIVWLVFGLSFVFMINLLMMDHIRGASMKYVSKLVQSSKKSIKKLRLFTQGSAKEGSAIFKKALHPRAPLKRVHSAPCAYYHAQGWGRVETDVGKCSLEERQKNGVDLVEQQSAL